MDLPRLFVLGAALTACALVVVLIAELRRHQLLLALGKPAASTGFLLAGWGAGAMQSAYGQVTFVALVLCFIGDVCLIARDKKAFLAGLVSFLLGHLGFAVAFGVRGIDLTVLGLTLVAMLAPALVIWRWLSPHVEPKMRAPVIAYIVVISFMVACAAGNGWRTHALLPLIGAVLFFLSDIAVARNRFVKQEVANRLWGLPLYFTSVQLLAATILER